MNHGTKDLGSSDDFDPLAYIESAFSDTKREPAIAKEAPELDVELQTIGQFLNRNGSSNGHASGTALVDPPALPGESEVEPTESIERLKFRKRSLSAPRPRKVKHAPSEDPIAHEMGEVWAALPRNIQFLSSFFDDSVTANYYRGEFKESREELIRRLLDPELTLEEVSRLLGVCPATVRRYTNRKWLAHHRTKGGQRRFRLSGVVKFVEEHGRHPEE